MMNSHVRKSPACRLDCLSALTLFTGSLAICIGFVCQTAMAAAPKAVSFHKEVGESLTARYGDQVLWQFHYGADLAKPFFDPVAVPGGNSLTWNSPPDHRWHHGLWFSWKYINRVNYWEPNNQTGKPDGRTEWKTAKIKTTQDGTATIQMRLSYRTDDAQPILTEERTITVSAPEADGSYHFDWQCVFTAGNQEVVLDRTPLPNEPGGKVFGGYAGLSVRFAKAMTKREAMTGAGPITFSPQSRFRGHANVMDYAGEIDGKEMGIAICDHPGNLNHPSPWYAIRSKTMSYYSPAVICYAPHTLKPGASFALRYRVIIHRHKWTATKLAKEYERFASE